MAVAAAIGGRWSATSRGAAVGAVDRGPAAPWLRLAALGALLAGSAAAAVWLPVPDPRDLAASSFTREPWAPALFAAVYAAATLTAVPKGVLSAGAGLLFGFALGSAVVWAAAVAGAAAAFGLGRALGRDAVARMLRGRAHRVDEALGRHGAWAVLGLRLVPLVPFTALNYGSGLSAVRFPGYLLATAVGIVPGTLAYVALGAYGTDPGSPAFAAAVAALVVLSAGGAALAHRRRRRRRRGA